LLGAIPGRAQDSVVRQLERKAQVTAQQGRARGAAPFACCRPGSVQGFACGPSEQRPSGSFILQMRLPGKKERCSTSPEAVQIPQLYPAKAFSV